MKATAMTRRLRLTWHVHAGGTAARPDKYGHTAMTDVGTYHIWPVSSPHNVNRHVGYIIHFANTAGRIGGGLWHRLDGCVNLAAAKRIATEHYRQLSMTPPPSE